MIINLNLDNRKQAVSTYLSLLYRFHKLSDRELELTVELIVAYMKALSLYENKVAAEKLYLEQEVREKIMKSLGLVPQVFRNYLTTLKKKNVLQDNNVINKVLIPVDDEGMFKIEINIKYGTKEVDEG